ncbi:hypothetical protein Vadar_003287 [Vaccinium darrowii]|uniref:Uncharacterized protein n=1 Tax=Vaccinium darrowii TaxID=229202 RepID=A0ACB7WXG3_9ERIC|nr:hypothetical protein Vadar_003287 [Vaccinium darrowii]
MAPFRMFDIVLHCGDKVVDVRNVDPDKYSYLDLLDDVSDTVLSYLPASKGVAIKLFCDIPSSSERREVQNDKDVYDMFYLGGGSEYEVNDEGISYTVNLAQWVCVCRVWQISGLPCKHALACCTYSRLNFVDYVHPYYNKEMYLAAYGSIIHPIMDHTMWTEVHGDVLQPPPLRRQRGRPRKNRRRAEGEAPPGPSVGKRSSTLRCAKCKEFGHNRRTCQGGPIRGGQARGGSRGRARGGSSAHGSGGNAIGWTQIDVEPVGRGRGRGRTSSAQRGRSTVRGRGRGRSTSAQRGRSTVRGRGKGRSSTSAVQYFGNEGTRGENIAASQGGTQPSQCLTQLTQHF